MWSFYRNSVIFKEFGKMLNMLLRISVFENEKEEGKKVPLTFKSRNFSESCQLE